MKSTVASAAVKDVTRWLSRRWYGLLLAIVGLVTTVYLAARSTQTSQPTVAEASFLTLVAAVSNILATAAFARIGRADPTLARSAVRRLFAVARPLALRVQTIQGPIDRNDNPEIARQARLLTVEVAMGLQSLQDAIADWNEVHGEALAEVMQEMNRQVVAEDA